MTCPSCNHILYSLTSETTLGTKIKVDRCGNCGGIWFDAYELTSIPFYEIAKLSKMSLGIRTLSKKAVRGTIKSDHLLCPKDHSALSYIDTELKPLGVHILECPVCKGIWASQKELTVIAAVEKQDFEKGDEKVFITPSISLASAIVASFLFMMTFVTILSLSAIQENRIKAETLVTQRVEIPISSDAVIVAFNTLTPMKATLSYGPSRFEMVTLSEEKEATMTHHILLGNLKPNTSYLYLISLNDKSGKTYKTGVYGFSR